MKYLRVFILVFFAFVLIQSLAEAQINISSISLRIGGIETETGHGQDEIVLNPELQIGGKLFTDYFNWGVNWSYWNDGINKEIPSSDFVTYNFSSHIVGCRLICSPMKIIEKLDVPIDIFAGVAEHFIKARYIGGAGLTGIGGSTYTKEMTTIELGLSLQIFIIERISALVEAQQYFPLGSDASEQIQQDRRAFKVGLSLSL
jgi:hypothetical protein